MKVTIASPGESPVKFGGRRHQLGLWGVTYYGGFYPFLNWWKLTGALELVSSTNGTMPAAAAFAHGYLDPNGDLIKPCPKDVTALQSVIFALKPDWAPKFAGEEIVMTWDGRGGNARFFNCPGSASYNQRNGRASFVMHPRDDSILSAGFTMKDGGQNDPPRNIKIFQKRYENETVIEGITYPGINQGGIFNPHWLHEMRNFGRLRLMDWNRTNDSNLVDYADWADEAYCQWGQHKGTGVNQFTKGGMPLSVICALAQQTGCDIWICIPHKATDACIQSIANYMVANFPKGQNLIIEYSNEVWNGQFAQQGYTRTRAASFPAFGESVAGGNKWTGYRAAQIMKIFRDAIDDRSRWRGVLATQTVNPVAVTSNMLAGVDYYLAEWNTAHPDSTIERKDLFDELSTTGYFGDFLTATQIAAVTNESNALITTGTDHGLSVGNSVTIGIRPEDGMDQLDSVTTTVTAVPSTTTFRIAVDTTAHAAFAPGGIGYVVDGGWATLMNRSEALFAAGERATKYDYFSEQLAEAIITGTCSSGLITVGFNLTTVNGYWLSAKTIADDNGWTLTQYEGGSGIEALTVVRDSASAFAVKWNRWVDAASYSASMAKVFGEMARQFFAIGGEHPSKFVEGGAYGKFGRWAGVRWWPTAGDEDGDIDNPVWKAVKAANAVYFAR